MTFRDLTADLARVDVEIPEMCPELRMQWRTQIITSEYLRELTEDEGLDVAAAQARLTAATAAAAVDPSVLRRDASGSAATGAAGRVPGRARPASSTAAAEKPAASQSITGSTTKTKARPARRAPSNTSRRSGTVPAGHAGSKDNGNP